MTTPSLRLRRLVEREAGWFFRELGGKVPEAGDPATRAAATQIDGWLREIPAFHRGVLALRYVRRPWPKGIVREFGGTASVVVRLECALHPAVGCSTEALEAASVERLQQTIQLCERARARREPAGRERPMSAVERALTRLELRAERHVDLAIRALARVRGRGPCLVPESGAQ